MQLSDCRVMVLKNDEQARDTTKEMLARMGFRENNIFLAKNIEEAKDIIASQRFNLILVGVDEGHILLKWLQIKGIRKLISFIFYSGGGEHYIRQKAKDCGADGYISSPPTLDEFMLKIKLALKQYKI